MSKNNNGVRNFTNDMEGEYIYIDKIGMEDLIKYHNINYKVIQGYYFNEGRNYKIKEVINYLYNERKKKKEEKNPIQECYKLIMNSSYGKTILKPSTTKTEIIFNKNFDKFINFNYNKIRDFKKLSDDKFLTTTYNPINNQFNIAHVGVEILSMSKRIMNEVMTLAEDNKIKLYYQDTDSMHIEYDKVKILEELFYKKYNRKLEGKNMGNFHIDFDLKGADKDTEIYATESVFLGKKCYIDKLECKNKDGKIINGYHIRMKGVNNQAILYECNKLNISPLDLYKKLYEGEKVRFDLTAGGKKCCFEYKTFTNVYTKNEFDRDICFNDNKININPFNRV